MLVDRTTYCDVLDETRFVPGPSCRSSCTRLTETVNIALGFSFLALIVSTRSSLDQFQR